MTTPLAHATAALTRAQEQLQQLDRQHQDLRRAYSEADQEDAGAIDARLASSNSAKRMAQVRVTEAQRQVFGAERDIEQARGMLTNHRVHAADCDSRARRLHVQAEEWERQRDQANIALALARVALAELLGIGIDEVDAQAAVSAPVVVERPLIARPRQLPSPRLVSEFGRLTYFNAADQEVAVDGSPLASK